MDNIHVNPVGIIKDIYKITNNINGKIYIGQAKNTLERFKSHCKKSSKDCLIDLAIQKYGKENFTVEILESQIQNYNEREKYWIKELKSKVPNGYNISNGGDEPPCYFGINHPNASIKDTLTLSKIIQDLIDTKDSYSIIAKRYGINKKTVLGINHGFRYFNSQLQYPLRQIANINGVLTKEDIENIVEELKYSYDTNTSIGEKYGVGERTIRDINNGKSHFNPSLDYPIRSINASKSKLNYDQIFEIADLLQHTDLSIREIARRYKVDRCVVQNINLGSQIYHRKEFTYPLRLPPHKK